jgi:hypothetical protein
MAASRVKLVLKTFLPGFGSFVDSPAIGIGGVLPIGTALVTEFAPTMIVMGVVGVAVDLEADKLGCDLGVALGASFRPAILDSDGATLDPAEFTQARMDGQPYSISSSASDRNDAGIVSPSAFAVVRLITSSNLPACLTSALIGQNGRIE